MKFLEAVVKMIEGKKMVNDKYPTVVYWFDRVEGRFVMKGKNALMILSAGFEEKEMKANWKEEDVVETYVDAHDLVIKNFESISLDDKEALFHILLKYKDTTTK